MCRCSNSHSSCPNHAADICLYVPFCIAFVVLGSVQIVSGIFYFMSLPLIKLLVQIGIGCWVILNGIATGMVACLCTSATRKHEFLLYCTLSVLVLNVLDVIYLESGQLKYLFGEHAQRLVREFEVLETPTARWLTTGAAIGLVLVAFVEAQLNFVLMHRCQRAHKKRKGAERRARQLYAGNDQSADLEYVLPKKPDHLLHYQTSISNSTDLAGLNTQSVQVHNKSWVFEATGDDDDNYDANHYGGGGGSSSGGGRRHHHGGDESSVSLCSSISPTHSNAHHMQHNHQHKQQRHQQYQQQLTTTGGGGIDGQQLASIGNGANRQRRISRTSDATSERFAMQMSSFSRCATPSPIPRSGQQSPAVYSDYQEPGFVKPSAAASSTAAGAATASSSSTAAAVSGGGQHQLTINYLAAAKNQLKPVAKSNAGRQGSSSQPAGSNHASDDSPYASLLAELGHSLHEKKPPNGAGTNAATVGASYSPDNTSLSTSDNKFSSKSASSASKELEFSKELEAALQLIQELETPSEGPYLGDTQLLHHHQLAAVEAARLGVDASRVATHLQLARSDSEKTLSAAVSLPSPEAGPLVDTSDGIAGGGHRLPTSASMHRLVIDVRAATTSPTSPQSTTDASGQQLMGGDHRSRAATTSAPIASTTAFANGKHVFKVFCSNSGGHMEGGSGSQSTSGYSSPSTSSQMTHSVRDSCSESTLTGSGEQSSGGGGRALNSFGGSNIIHVQAASAAMHLSQPHQPPSVNAASLMQRRQLAAMQPLHNSTTMFINTLEPPPRLNLSAGVITADYRSPIALTASPASRSQSGSLAADQQHANGGHAASKSFLLFKKRSKLMPQSDFQNRIFKSECLAYLTEEELLQRHQLNRNVIRNIELNVARRVKGCQQLK